MLELGRWLVERWRELDRGMADMRDLSFRSEGRERARFTPLAPAIEAFSEREDLIIRVELPGLEPEEVDLLLEDGVLIVSGERKGDAAEVAARHYYACEPRYGPFRRIITVPGSSKTSGEMRTAFERGVLEVAIRGEASAARQVRLEPSAPTRM